MKPYPPTTDALPSTPYIKLAVLVGVVVVLFATTLFINTSAAFSSMREWVAGQGRWVPVMFVLIYAAAVVAAAPGFLLTASAGALFGSVTGTVVVSLGATIGAGAAFIIARFVARDTVSQWLAKREMYQKLDALTARRGAVVVAVVRLIPLFPSNLVNYAFGLTRIRFRTYLFWSWLCMLPEMAFYVIAADVLVTALRSGTVPWALLGVVVVLGVMLAIVFRRVRSRIAAERAKALDAELEGSEPVARETSAATKNDVQ